MIRALDRHSIFLDSLQAPGTSFSTGAFLASWVPQVKATCLWLWGVLKMWNSFPLELQNVDGLLFFTVEKCAIVATLAGVVLHWTVTLPWCSTVCSMPFLRASALWILQLTVWKEAKVISQEWTFLPTNTGIIFVSYCSGHSWKCKCVKFYCHIIHKRHAPLPLPPQKSLCACRDVSSVPLCGQNQGCECCYLVVWKTSCSEWCCVFLLLLKSAQGMGF